jgi:hypothetical protein
LLKIFRAGQEQSKNNREKRKKPRRRKRSNRLYYRVFSNRLRRFRQPRQVKSTTRPLFALISKLVFARRERDANILTI